MSSKRNQFSMKLRPQSPQKFIVPNSSSASLELVNPEHLPTNCLYSCSCQGRPFVEHAYEQQAMLGQKVDTHDLTRDCIHSRGTAAVLRHWVI